MAAFFTQTAEGDPVNVGIGSSILDVGTKRRCTEVEKRNDTATTMEIRDDLKQAGGKIDTEANGGIFVGLSSL